MIKNSPTKIWICLLAAAGALIPAGGCRPGVPAPSGQAADLRQASVVYDLACTGMATAGNMDEFAASHTSLDLPGLDFSKENPERLIRALRHGIYLVKAADLKTKSKARKTRSKEKQLKQRISILEKEVQTLRHQITVLENIDQERQEKRKTQ